MDALYTATATATGGRQGRSATDDGKLDVQLDPPAELGGPADGTGTNPEQLFAAGYAACFHSSIQLLGAKRDHDLTDSSVTARVGLGPVGRGLGLSVTLEVALPKLERADAEKLVEKAHVVCPYSNATRGNVEVDVQLVDPPA